MTHDPTKITIAFDPLTERMRGITAHGRLSFDMPYISPIGGNLYVGGCREGLVLPPLFRHVVSLYPWERYRVDHELESFTEVRAYDADVAPLVDRLGPLVSWTEACLAEGPTLVHCQAGLNRSNLLAALVLIRGGMSADRAIGALRKRRSPAVLCNPSFEAYLRTVG